MDKKELDLIFTGDSIQVSYADVQHVENIKGGIWVITKHTKYNFERDTWENPVFIGDTNEQSNNFMSGWHNFIKKREESSAPLGIKASLRSRNRGVEKCKQVFLEQVNEFNRAEGVNYEILIQGTLDRFRELVKLSW